MSPSREQMLYDVVIVGAGPSGLAAAISLKQHRPETTICLLEKGQDVGAHILSGAIMDPVALDALLPQWRTEASSFAVPVATEHLAFFGKGGDVNIPHFLLPPPLKNEGCYVTRLGFLCQYLAKEAEKLGVEIFTGMAASELIVEENIVKGVIAGEFGKDKHGTPKAGYEPGVELRATHTLLGEGARGSLSEQLIRTFSLREGVSPPQYGLGLKEIWELPPNTERAGHILHTFGWPLSASTGGGGFVYGLSPTEVAVGFVVHLNYQNPTLSPYEEFQSFKHHPRIQSLLEGGKRIAYGARAITEGGFQSLPRLGTQGALLLGCSAGMVNVARLKGIHNALWSGQMAAKALVEGFSDPALCVHGRYDSLVKEGVIGKDLRKGCNLKPLWSRYGLWGALAGGGLDMWAHHLTGRGLFSPLPHLHEDRHTLRPLSEVSAKIYPSPDGRFSFDRLTNLAYGNVNHEENQPLHLILEKPYAHVGENLSKYGEPAQLYCPAGVYEIISPPNGEKRFQINGQNCLHCKTCDIKDPAGSIRWTPPEGGGGPLYSGM